MEKSSDKTAQRMRPYLAAMERAINEARRRRTGEDEPAATPQENASAEPAASPPSPPEPSEERAEDPTRLKARPKRPQNLPSHFTNGPNGTYQSRAG